ncbi:MAG: TIGR01212 family radical SAM protein [Tissierellia bacterium]|nr:TIGR01212 family radical SAM protein [Tissierellia bacterium]
MKNNLPYYPISEYYRKHFGSKVYKLPIKLDLTCPNRDGTLSDKGCIFCGESGGSFENRPSSLTIKRQLELNKAHIEKKYKANKFIAYFQNFSNTYMSLKTFKEIINACNLDYIVGIDISTRSDCISEDKLIFLKKFKEENKKDITIELGLQTANYHTQKILNRKEDLATFIRASNLIKKYNLKICTHVILSLPWDDLIDVKQTARIIKALDIDFVKIHSLYITKDTELSNMYQNSKLKMISQEEFVIRVSEFLKRIDKNCAVERLLARAPKEESVFCNWDKSWWVIRDHIIDYMNENNIKQGIIDIKRDFEKIGG